MQVGLTGLLHSAQIAALLVVRFQDAPLQTLQYSVASLICTRNSSGEIPETFCYKKT